MSDSNQIQWVLEGISFATLGGLAIFQYLHFVIASWRFWEGNKNRILYTALIALYWIAHGSFFLSYVPNIASYEKSVPYILLALYSPSIFALIGFAISPTFRRFSDQISLPWAIASVEGPARMIVGVLFLFWYFAGRLPGVVAWIAGPGDWIAGFISFYAVAHLSIFSKKAGISKKDWSLADLQASNLFSGKSLDLSKMKRKLNLAILMVAFGILDFFAAPISTQISVFWDNPPQEMGLLPLGIIPMLLVPQVLLLEVFAMRQMLVLKKQLNKMSLQS
ncbi:MAG: hypothetical protein AAFR87_14725 [Bacteroidota bacterium]